MKLKHVISTKQFLDTAFLEELYELADKMEKWEKARMIPDSLEGKVMATVFYEPSTRTRFSFEAAMYKLGGRVITTESAGHFSSAIKGETIEDSARIISGYADVIVLRSPEKGYAQRAAIASSVPVINAGDGKGEHPTQALLDMYTIHKELGTTSNLKVALVGDLLNGRTIHSLVALLSAAKDNSIYLVSPPELKLPEEYKDILKHGKVWFKELQICEEVLDKVDVLYMTRIQKERFEDKEAYEKLKSAFVITPESLGGMKDSAIIMHPLPRVTEIAPEVDKDPRAAYFRQAKNGLYIRMALLKTLLVPD